MSWVTDRNAAILTDLYELTMAASYYARRMNGPATFDLFVRTLPERRNFLIACGLEQALDYLEGLHFEADSLDYLRSLGIFSDDFLEYLAQLRFTGEVWAVPEGQVAFAQEPLLTVTAPLIEAQLVETFLLNCITFQTMIASKAARVALACGGRASFVDFSPRRDHGADAALKAARAAFVGGASATSNVLAGRLYGIRVSGTMAHSYIMAFENEAEAFRTFARHFPDRAIFLIDTYDTEAGAQRAAAVAGELAPEGIEVQAVRLDSGDIAALSRSVRGIFDTAGLGDVKIFVSGDMDEYRIKELLDAGAPVDAFGVGTQLGTSGDEPTLGGVYKLVADERRPKIKLSTGKVTLPGRKQVHRYQEAGRYLHDLIALHEERHDGEPLLARVMERGRRTGPREPLEALRERRRGAVACLPEPLRSLTQRHAYEVRLSGRLEALVDEMRRGGRSTR